MADNFNMKQFLAENKMGPYAKANEAKITEATKYQPGDMWSSDFDYKGMLKAAANLSVSSPEELMQAISDSFEDVNYHRENSHLQDAIEAKKENDNDAIKFHLALFKDELKKTINNIKKTQIFEREKVEEGHEEGMADMIHMEEGEASYEYEKGKEAGEKEEETKEEFNPIKKIKDFAGEKGWNFSSRRPTSEEDKIAQEYMQSQGKKVGSIGVDRITGNINVMEPNGDFRAILSSEGEELSAWEMDIHETLAKEDIGGDIGDIEAAKQMDFLAEKDKVKEALSPEAFERMSGLVKTRSVQQMIMAAEDMMNDLTADGFEVEEVREFFTQLIANDI